MLALSVNLSLKGSCAECNPELAFKEMAFPKPLWLITHQENPANVHTYMHTHSLNVSPCL